MTDSDIQLDTGILPLPGGDRANRALTPTPERKRGRPKRVGDFRRLDIEIDKVDCERIDEIRAAFGARSTVEAIRHALRIISVLIFHARKGYDIQLVNEQTKHQFSVKLI